MKNIFFLSSFIIFFLTSCKQEPKDPYPDVPWFKDLKGNEHYEIISVSNKYDRSYGFDTLQKVYLFSNTKKDMDYKLNNYKEIIDSMSSLKIIKNDTFYVNNNYIDTGGSWGYYSKWLATGDTTIYKYIDVFPNEKEEKIDCLVYLNKHKELYQKATDTYYYYYYYYYINDNWYRMNPPFGKEIEEQYPEKHQLQGHTIGTCEHTIPPLHSKAKYIPLKKHKVRSGGMPGTFTTGYWLVKTGLPGGDTLVYKNMADGLGSGIGVCQIPKKYGGNDSVLFIGSGVPTIPTELKDPKERKKFIDEHSHSFVIRPRRKKK